MAKNAERFSEPLDRIGTTKGKCRSEDSRRMGAIGEDRTKRRECGGEGMLTMMLMLYTWIWKNEYPPRRWREGVVVNLFEKGDKADPGNYRGITLVSTVGKTFKNIFQR